LAKVREMAAPALAQADIGIAIGAGTDVAIETAQVVLMKSDPLDIVNAITISKATVRKMKQNLVWASVYIILAIPVAAGVLYPSLGIVLRPEWSALLMSLSSILRAASRRSEQRQPPSDRRIALGHSGFSRKGQDVHEWEIGGHFSVGSECQTLLLGFLPDIWR
jgi:hypothetical protein